MIGAGAIGMALACAPQACGWHVAARTPSGDPTLSKPRRAVTSGRADLDDAAVFKAGES